jgi:hypothetical protein
MMPVAIGEWVLDASPQVWACAVPELVQGG